MSKTWIPSEEAVISRYMGGRRVLYKRDKLAIHKLLPKRSHSAIEKRWGIMLKRKKPSLTAQEWLIKGGVMGPNTKTEVPNSPVFLSRDGVRFLDNGEMKKIGPEHNTLTGIHPLVNYLRSYGLRGRVTIELGE